MTDRGITWAPRIGGAAFAVALPVIAVRSFTQGVQDPEAVIALVMHMLLAALLLILVHIAWRKEWLGWVGALSMMAFYFWTDGPSVPWNDTTLIVNGLPILGLLYAWNTVRHQRPAPGMTARRSGEFPLFAGEAAPPPQRRSGGYRPTALQSDRGRPVESLIFLTQT